MKVTMLLADAAQVAAGKLYVLGGGWSLVGPDPTPSAIAIKIDVPWEEANRRHTVRLTLTDGDYRPILVPTPVGDRPVEIEGHFEAGRPAGLKAGSLLDVALALNIGPLPLQPDRRYVWRCTIDGRSSVDWGHTEGDWEVAFSTRARPQA